MKKQKIIDLLKQLEKEICNPRICPSIEYEECSKCNIHRIVNMILEELNGE